MVISIIATPCQYRLRRHSVHRDDRGGMRRVTRRCDAAELLATERSGVIAARRAGGQTEFAAKTNLAGRRRHRPGPAVHRDQRSEAAQSAELRKIDRARVGAEQGVATLQCDRAGTAEEKDRRRTAAD